MERLELFKESVLKSIYNYCDSVYCGDDKSIHDTIDYWHNGQVIGRVYFDVSCEIDRWGEHSFVLQESEVNMILNYSYIEMPNITNLLNKELILHQGEYLNY